MGKMLDSFQQARSRRGPAQGDSPSFSVTWPEEDEAPSAEDMPFIEVGGPRLPGEVVLPDPTVFALAAAAPVPVPKPSPVPTPPGLMTVRFRPLEVERPQRASPRLAVELVAFHQPEHAISGQYRDLTTGLLVQTPAQQPRVLLFTGASAGAGTTTVTLNAAITLARHNLRRVVVIDAHWKRPAVAARLGLSEAPGLRDVLGGRVSLDEAMQVSAQSGLSALTAGSPEATPATRLAGERMRSLLAQLRDGYDLVLIDAACWDGRPDVVALGCACDAVYLCLPEKDQERTETRELLEVIPEQGASLRGCIVTSR